MAKQLKQTDSTKKVTIDITKKEPINRTENETKKESKMLKKDAAIVAVDTKSSKIRNKIKVVEKYNLASVIMISLVLFIFSFIIAAQLNTVGNTDIISTGMREAELLAELQKAQDKYETLKKEHEKNQVIVEEYKTNASSNDALIASMKISLDHANLLAGLTNVKGEGVVVILQDSTDTNMPLEAGLVHDTDIMSIVNELRAAGAEAISVNGERILSTTAIRCVGPTIQINGTKVASPFHIKAIGNSKYLESALNLRGGVVDSLKAYGVQVEITINEGIIIDKYDETLILKYASETK